MSYYEAWKRCRDFYGKTGRSEYWMALIIHTLISLLLMLCLAFGFAVWTNLSPEDADKAVSVIFSLFELSFLMPYLAMTVRRLRDAGYSAKSFFWLFVPIIGEIAFFARLCSASAEEQTTA